MKGVILAGGEGTRLHPNTKVTNKHLLPVYNQPMIYYPIQTLLRAGISDILILPGKNHAGDFAKLLGSGRDFNANFRFTIQDHAGGLAYAVGLAEDFVGSDNFVVILGDNILEDNIIEDIQNFNQGAKVFLKQVPDPQRFGVAELEGTKVISIEEKPEIPKSNWAAIGLYIYDSKAFEYIKTLKPSPRGELEITDLNNIYIQKNQMNAGFIKGFWYDTGTHESLVDAAYSIKNIKRPIEPLQTGKKNAPKIVIGGILYNKGPYGTDRFLKYFVESIKKQNYQNKSCPCGIEIIFVDNSPEKNNLNSEFLSKNYPEIEIIYPGKNIGFAKANNIMIKRALELGADYFVASNLDMIYDTDVISELVNAVIKTPQIASATCKIKRWDFADRDKQTQGKTNCIDSTGITITREHRFIDRGQGEIDHKQFDQEEEIFGASGALVIYRMSALEDVAFITEDGRKEYFDELMFMYKEDIDLSYRLQLAGYKCIYTPLASAYHDRTVESSGHGIINIVKSRKGRDKKYKEWSWLNHHIILKKILKFNTTRTKAQTLWYEIKSNIYVLIAEPFLLKQVLKLWKLRKQIRARRTQIKKRVKMKHIERFMI